MTTSAMRLRLVFLIVQISSQREKFGKNGKFIPIKPPIPVERFSIRCKLDLVDNLPVKVKQTPNRAPISESLSAVDPTTGASRPISM